MNDVAHKIEPPVARIMPEPVKSPHGTRIDPYYWLRDDTRMDTRVLGYLADENAYVDAVMAPLAPLQKRLYGELIGRIKQDDATVPYLERGYYYYTRYVTGGEYPIHARRKGSLDAPEEILLDGNALAAGHEFHQIGAFEVSPNNRLLAYAEDNVGRRQYIIRVRDLDTGKVLEDRIENAEPGMVWADDNRSVLYIEKDPVTLLGFRVKRHRLGTGAHEDQLLWEQQDESFYTDIVRSKSQRYIFIGTESTVSSEWWYARADDPSLEFKRVLERERDHEYQIEHLNDRFVIRTNWNAPNFRVMEAPIATAHERSTWREVIPHREDVFVHDFEVFRDHIAVAERSAGLRRIRVRGWQGGGETVIAADEPAYTALLGTNVDIDTHVLRYTYTSLRTPTSTYDYDMRTGERRLLKRDPVLGDFDPANYVTEYVHAPAPDGARVPISLVYRKGTPRDGTAPLYLYAYGSYGSSTDPVFSSSRLSLLDRGFVYAIAHVRGGQELGRRWYDDGRLMHKVNTFTDFIAVTDHLVQQGYAARDKVFAHGRSAGGLLMGAIANIAPQKYRAILTDVPFVDVVTTMLDESIPLTTGEFDEWGNPEQAEYYDYMLAYSPYDQVKPQAYPAMLVTTGLWDSQVQYYEPAKWVAKLRATKTDHNPLLFRTYMEAGHGGKSGRFQTFHETAMRYAFVLDLAGARP
ncbi:MAG TPA: S9 family peptidase [Steroidobacteraceae bacterium]|nr:S9 family peptidase [Steroidobacteraceae bacterium]